MDSIRILVADDHAVVRSGLKLLLANHGLQVVAEAASGEEAVTEALRENPDLVLMDVTMPPGQGGLEATRRLKELAPQIPVIVLTMHNDESLRESALEAGAFDYVLKQAPETTMISAILNACPRAQKANPKEILTGREFEVLCLMARGYGNKEIANQLNISVKTVETHRTHLFLKLGLESRADLVEYALGTGLLHRHE